MIDNPWRKAKKLSRKKALRLAIATVKEVVEDRIYTKTLTYCKIRTWAMAWKEEV